MRANMWKSRRARDQHKILRLCRDIATHVLRDDGFVFFHFDGDAVWAQGVSENVARFDAVIRAKVRDLIRGELREDSLLEPVMDRFVHLVPHYSIETWLFANVAALRQLDVSAAVLEDWEADLTRLDTALQPKKLLRVAAEAYPTLARKLAADHLLGLGTSFCDAVTRAGACGSLVVRLRHR
jgi:hypothetical protein